MIPSRSNLTSSSAACVRLPLVMRKTLTFDGDSGEKSFVEAIEF